MTDKVDVLKPVRTKNYSSDGITVTVNASDVAREIAEAVANHHQDSIGAGNKASGGKQRKLSSRAMSRASKGKRSPFRGMGTRGTFQGSIRHRATKGKRSSTGTVSGSAFFDGWLAQESGRGVEYYFTDGEVDKIVDKIIEERLRKDGFTD